MKPKWSQMEPTWSTHWAQMEPKYDKNGRQHGQAIPIWRHVSGNTDICKNKPRFPFYVFTGFSLSVSQRRNTHFHEKWAWRQGNTHIYLPGASPRTCVLPRRHVLLPSKFTQNSWNKDFFLRSCFGHPLFMIFNNCCWLLEAPREPKVHITEAPRTFSCSGKSAIVCQNAVLPRRRAHPFPSKPLFWHVFVLLDAPLGSPRALVWASAGIF